MVIGIHTVRIRVKVPNLLISSNLRELVGGGLCSKGAERPGKVTIEKLEEDRVFFSVYNLELSDVIHDFDVEGCACDLFVLVQATSTHPEKASSCGEEWSGDKVGVFRTTQSPLLAQVAS